MGTIFKLMNSDCQFTTSEKITSNQLKFVSDNAKLHGMHKPYTCDFKQNKAILAERKRVLAEKTPSCIGGEGNGTFN